MNRFLLTILFFCLSTNSYSAEQKEIKVACAANLAAVMPRLIEKFESTHPNYKISYSLASSGNLCAGITNGARFDLFLAANMHYPQKLSEQGLTLPPVAAYCEGELILFTTHTEAPKTDWFAWISSPPHTVSIANPQLAPYGRAAKEVLIKRGIYHKIQDRLTIAENVSQTIQHCFTGTDCAFIPKSALFTPHLQKFNHQSIYWRELAKSAYSPILQGMVKLKNGKNPKGGAIFFKFMKSNSVQKTLLDYGYLAARNVPPPLKRVHEESEMSWQPFYVSLKLALLTTLILFCGGLPLACLLAFKRFPGRILIDTLATLPLVLPPTVLGFYILIALGPRHGLGRLLDQWFDIRLIYNFHGILIASCIYSLPFMLQPIKSGLIKLDKSLIEASYTLGKGKWETLRHVILPNIKPALWTGLIMTFAHTLGEFGVILMVGGNISSSTRPVSIAIYEKVEGLELAPAHLYSAVLLVLSFMLLLTMNWLNQRAENNHDLL